MPGLAAEVQGHIEHGLPLSDVALALVSGNPMMLVIISMWAGRLRARLWAAQAKERPRWREPIKRAEALAVLIAERLTQSRDYWQAEAIGLADELKRLEEARHDYW